LIWNRLQPGLPTRGGASTALMRDARSPRQVLSTELSTAILTAPNSRKNMCLAQLLRKVLEL
jgi:hypothetical protein